MVQTPAGLTSTWFKHDKGLPAPGLLAHVAISKFLDHQPLYRQEGQFARLGVALSRSTLAGWLGQLEVLLEPLVGRLIEHLHAQSILHADETTVPVLDPGAGRTATGYLWAYRTGPSKMPSNTSACQR